MTTTGMSLYERMVFPRILEVALERPGVRRLRVEALAPARGEVLEIGAGTGQNFGHYPPAVKRLVALTPEPQLDRRARRRARRASVAIEHVSGDGRQLPFEDRRFDTVVTSLVLCTIPDPYAVVRECARVLRRGGKLLFFEHVVSPSRVERGAQLLAEPLLRRINCGCSLLRDTVPVIERAGFELLRVRTARARAMPPLYQNVVIGVASPRR